MSLFNKIGRGLLGAGSGGDGEPAKRDAKLLAAAGEQFEAYLAEDAAVAAQTLWTKMRGVGDGLKLSRQQALRLADGLDAAGRSPATAPLLAGLIEAEPELADPLRVRLAGVCVEHLNRPGRAIDLLAAINPHRLTDEECLRGQALAAEAEHMQDDGVVELDDGQW